MRCGSRSNNTFENNSAPNADDGGGVGGAVDFAEMGSVNVTNNLFSANSAGTHAGALLDGSSGYISLTGNIFRNNVAANAKEVELGGEQAINGIVNSASANTSIVNSLVGNNQELTATEILVEPLP